MGLVVAVRLAIAANNCPLNGPAGCVCVFASGRSISTLHRSRLSLLPLCLFHLEFPDRSGTIDVVGGVNVAIRRVDVTTSQCYDAGGCLAATGVTNLEIADSSFVDCSVSASGAGWSIVFAASLV